MISINSVKMYCSENISNIENYELAIKDDVKWVCHHRLEIVNGKSIPIKELMEKNLYYHRPANELIFMSELEHKKLHNKYMRKETRERISRKSKEWHASSEGKAKCTFVKGKHPWNYGLPSPVKGTKKSLETIQKMKESKQKWWNEHTITEDEHKRRSEGGKRGVTKCYDKLKEYGKEYSKLYKGRHWKVIDGKRVWL